jgi:adenosylcobinamide-GDP ribazoletransferase
MNKSPRLQHARVAAAFLTRIPIGHGEEISMSRIVRWFPVIGLFIGVTCGGAYVALREVLPALSASVLSITLGILITGGFHHDGLADSADGLVGGWTPEQRREILKDSRHGTYGVLALVAQVLLQVSLLTAMMHCIGRAGAVAIMTSATGISEGLGANYVRGVTNRDVMWASLFAVAVSILFCGWWGLVLITATAGMGRLVLAYAVKKIGGIVGDILGAVEQVGETTILIVVGIVAMKIGSISWWLV